MDIWSTLGTAMATAGKLRQLAEKIKDAETRNLIADLNLSLADLKLQCVNLQEENLKIKALLRDVEERANHRADVELREGLYFLTNAVQGRPEGPYCPRCLDADEKLILVAKAPMTHFGRLYCNNCKSFYK